MPGFSRMMRDMMRLHNPILDIQKLYPRSYGPFLASIAHTSPSPAMLSGTKIASAAGSGAEAGLFSPLPQFSVGKRAGVETDGAKYPVDPGVAAQSVLAAYRHGERGIPGLPAAELEKRRCQDT